jgi:hypothetical protein
MQAAEYAALPVQGKFPTEKEVLRSRDRRDLSASTARLIPSATN